VFKGSWAGVGVVIIGALLHVVGHLATLFVIQQYAMLLVFYGLVLSFIGWPAFRRIAVPLLLLIFMIPLPEFLYRNFSAELQLISSQIGVWFIRLFGISVHLEGNVIDLGRYKLQVAEACDGLRYLFPLMTLGFVIAYFYKDAMWKRVLVVVSTIPITILMNSFRVAVIGITVRHWGVSMAEGFLHEFQGWVVFMASTAVLLVEVLVLSRIGSGPRPWREVFSIDLPRRVESGPRTPRPVPKSMIVGAALVATYATALALVPERSEAVPARPSFAGFPGQLGPWSGRSESLEPMYLQVLRLSDYYVGDFTRAGTDPAAPPVNLYVAWYDSQRSGQSAHSPRSCLPGGGWRIDQFEQVRLEEVDGPQGPLKINRALISHGKDRQLVYYWFQQRGRVITNEYLVKWFLVQDALVLQRTDGALVRVTTPLRPGEDPSEGDRRLADFISHAMGELRSFVPN
jgi:exosortase D (VPLPA-CTERM-specific)